VVERVTLFGESNHDDVILVQLLTSSRCLDKALHDNYRLRKSSKLTAGRSQKINRKTCKSTTPYLASAV